MKLIYVLVLLLSGCATTQQTCRFEGNPPVLVAIETESWIVGTGETTLRTTACGVLRYTTLDTGLSDNARLAIEKAAEGAARGAVEALTP